MNPEVYNPLSGYIINWNNSPQKDYPASDLFAFLWKGADRVTKIDRLLEQRPRLAADQIWGVIHQTSRQDLNLRPFLPTLQAATSGLIQNDPRRQLVDTLTRWNGVNLFNGDGKTWQQPGSTILNVWLASMLKCIVVAAVPMPFDKWYSTNGYETTQDGLAGPLNVSVGAKVLYEVVQGNRSPTPQAVGLFTGEPQQEVVLTALGDTWEALSKHHGNDISNQKTPAMALTFRANSFFGVPQVAAEETRHRVEYQNRGTESDMVVFSPATSDRLVLAWDMVAPDQNGFITPDGTIDKHYEDQLKMYESFDCKSLWLMKQDVEAHKEPQGMLHVQR